jgi:hypothetical protein
VRYREIWSYYGTVLLYLSHRTVCCFIRLELLWCIQYLPRAKSKNVLLIRIHKTRIINIYQTQFWLLCSVDHLPTADFGSQLLMMNFQHATDGVYLQHFGNLLVNPIEQSQISQDLFL